MALASFPDTLRTLGPPSMDDSNLDQITKENTDKMASLAIMHSFGQPHFGQPFQDRLPPLSEAVPEIWHARPTSDKQSQFLRSLYESPKGPGRFPEAHSLAPSPLLSSRSRSSLSIPPQTSPASYTFSFSSNRLSPQYPSDSSVSSDHSDRRGSQNSATSVSISESSRTSPSRLSIHALQEPTRVLAPEIGRPQCSLPPIFTSCEPSHQSLPPPYIHRDSFAASPHDFSPSRQMPYPLQFPSGPPQDYQYSVGGHYTTRPPFRPGSGNANYPQHFEAVGEFGDGKQKRRRGNLPKAVTDILRVWFTEHVAHPYPTEEEKQSLMVQTGLTISQISNWFINARRRSLPQMAKQAQTEADLREKAELNSTNHLESLQRHRDDAIATRLR